LNYKYAIKRLKLATGADTDVELRGKALISISGFNSIKKGTCGIAMIVKLCQAWNVKPSAFVRWAEEAGKEMAND